jgi:hypothetical protein
MMRWQPMLGLSENRHWRKLKRAIVWGSRRSFLEAVTVTFVFPLVEAYLVGGGTVEVRRAALGRAAP